MKRIAARDRHIPANAVKVGLLAFAVLIAAQVSGWSVLDTLFFRARGRAAYRLHMEQIEPA